MKRTRFVFAAAGALAALVGWVASGCSTTTLGDGLNTLASYSGSPGTGGLGSGGEFGATQGGVQDLSLARELVQNGRVPPAAAFPVEGMFSEHDLPLTGDACERTLCLRAALGIAPDSAGQSSGWLQIGLSSTIDMESFQRPTQTLIACVDVSGSMGWPYSTEAEEYPTPGTVARSLLRAIVQELNAGDRFAMVSFGDEVHDVLALTAGDQQAAIEAAVAGLSEDGATYMEAGLRRAYEVAAAADGGTELVRVMLFTDAQPNVGATEASEFEQIVDAGIEQKVGITVFAFGVGIGQEVLNGMAHLRGGNAFSLMDFDDVPALMEESWPWLVSPIAYDLRVTLTPAAAFKVGNSYGFPAAAPGENPGLEASTVFLSKKKGALLVQLVPVQGTSLTGLSVAGKLTYVTPAGEGVSEEIAAAYNDEPLNEFNQYFPQPSVAKTVALALLTASMYQAAEQYGTSHETAIRTLEAAIVRYTADIASLDDATLSVELDFAKQLLELMKQGAEQGDLYGYGQG